MKKNRIKIKATSATMKISATEYHNYKEQLHQMDNKALVAHRKQLMKQHDGLADEYWNRMWAVNAEMAQRFSKMVREGEIK